MSSDLIFILVLFLLVVSYLFYRYMSRAKKLEALLKIAESGGNIDQETFKMFSGAKSTSYKVDIKLGLLWLAVGVPLWISVWAVDGFRASLPATIPICVGIAYMISAKYRLRES